MVAIRKQMGEEQLPSFLRRSTEKQELLNKVRQLRRGDVGADGIIEVQEGEFVRKYDLKPFAEPAPLYATSLPAPLCWR